MTKTKENLINEFAKRTADSTKAIFDKESCVFKNVATKREYETENRLSCIKRQEKKNSKLCLEKLDLLDQIYTSELPDFIGITVEWKRSAMWGMNPKAEIAVRKTGEWSKRFESRSVSGCGFDKESTAIAEALNQSLSIRKLLCMAIDNGVELPYGFETYSGIPAFSGGVGVSCFREIFEVLGYKWESIADTKTTNVYTIRKK
jgi:hypothetical protein